MCRCSKKIKDSVGGCKPQVKNVWKRERKRQDKTKEQSNCFVYKPLKARERTLYSISFFNLKTKRINITIIQKKKYKRSKREKHLQRGIGGWRLFVIRERLPCSPQPCQNPLIPFHLTCRRSTPLERSIIFKLAVVLVFHSLWGSCQNSSDTVSEFLVWEKIWTKREWIIIPLNEKEYKFLAYISSKRGYRSNSLDMTEKGEKKKTDN